MKIKHVLFIFAIALLSRGTAQDVGKVIIKNAKENFPKFIVSLNGIRMSNEYGSAVTFDYLDEYNYKVSILQAGSKNTLSFMVYSAPNYISTYLINKDTYGNYLFNLESKVMMSDSAAAVTKSSAPVAASPSAATSATTGKLIEEEEYFDIVKTLKKEPNEKNRVEMAKTIFGTKWLLASMVVDALKMFRIEASRVAFAKFAYTRTLDKQNYYKVFDSFSLTNSKKEINEVIKTTP
jgi:hypothetical protein